jgi:Phosphodiester glycosidase
MLHGDKKFGLNLMAFATFAVVAASAAVVMQARPGGAAAAVAASAWPSPAPCPTSWCVTSLAPGVTRMYRTAGLPSGVPRVNVVDIDPAAARVAAVESAYAPQKYETVQSMAQRTGAVVGINGGFFNDLTPPTPPPFRFVSLLKLDGTYVHDNPAPRPVLGLRAGPRPSFVFGVVPTAKIGVLTGYPDAVGAGPFIVNRSGTPRAQVLQWSADPGGFNWVCSPHPRSAAWVLANGHLLLGAFDGADDGSGFWLDTPSSTYCTTHPDQMTKAGAWNGLSLGQFILSNFPSTVQAMNLDGGGSTTFVVNGQIVNVPSVTPARPVIDGLMVYAAAGRRPQR